MPTTAQKTATKSFTGTSIAEQLASKILPVLIRQAQAAMPISYSSLAAEVGTHQRVIGKCLSIVGNELLALGNENGLPVAPPLINAIVVNLSTGEPSGGVNIFLEQKLGSMAKPEDRQVAINLFQSESYHYKYWNDVLTYFKMTPATPAKSVADLKPKPQKHGKANGGEGPEHATFKEFISKHPQLFGIAKAQAETEYPLASGDAIDVLFSNDKLVVGVEVKSKTSDEDDIKRGMFQTVKYKAVLEAMEKLTPRPRRVKVYLALQDGLSADSWFISCKNTLGIEVKERLEDK